MTEQAVKDAKAKRDAAQADLDKAVKDTKDEVTKALAAVSDATGAKSDKDPAPVAAKEPEKAEPSKPVPAAPSKPAPKPVPVIAAVPSASSPVLKIAIVLAVVAVIVAVVLHAKGVF